MLAFMKTVMYRYANKILLTGALALGAYTSAQAQPYAPAPTTVNERALVLGVLAAEFALQEGDITTAASTYAEIARRSRDAKVAERAVELLLRSRRTDEAKEITAIWQASDPGSARANQIGLAIALGSNDSTLALKSVSRVVDLPEDKRGDAMMELARQLAQHKDRDFAVKLASVFTTTHPELAQSHYALSVASTGTDGSRINEALLAIDKALSIKPNWPQAVAVKSRLLAVRAEKSTTPGARALANGEGVKLLSEGVAANPDSRDLKQLLARTQYDLGEFAASRKLFLDLADDGKEDAEEMQLAATLAAFSAQDWDVAEREFNEALAAEKGDANALRYYLGRISEAKKRWVEAAERYAQVQRTGQGDRYWESQLRIAGVLGSDKRLLQAMSHLKQMAPTNAFERVTRAQTESNLWRDAGDNQKAFDALETALKTDAENTDLMYESAMLAERLNQMDDAEKRLRRVIELEPKRAHAYNALGYSLADRNIRLDEARTLIEKGHEIAPEDPAIIDSMGWIAFRQGRLKEAEEHLRRAYGKFKDGEIAAHLGEVLWAQGRKDEARGVWHAQMKVQPDSDILKKTMQRLDPK
jgi:tetratricopeptide (TPR) repeat protein